VITQIAEKQGENVMADDIAKRGLEMFSRRFSELPENFISVLLSASYCSRKSKRIFLDEGIHGKLHRYTASVASNPHVRYTFDRVQEKEYRKNFYATSEIPESRRKSGHLERAQLHILFLAPFGFGKTSTFDSLDDSYILKRITPASIMGTITRDGDFAQGVSQKAAGKFVVFDEIQNSSSDSRDAMLAMLEEQTFSRSLGYVVKTPIEMNMKKKEFEKKHWSVSAQNCDFSVRSVFSACCTGLESMSSFLRSSRNENTSAWLSRLVPVIMKGSADEAYRIRRGELCFSFYKNIKPYEHQMYFKDYIKAVDMHEQYLKTLPFASFFEGDKAGILTRNVGDTVRLAAYFCACENRSEITLEDFNMALSFQPITLYNMIASYLTRLEYDILSQLLFGREASKIAESLSCTVQHVYDTKQKLLNTRLMTE
jgi:hypothetical protein